MGARGPLPIAARAVVVGQALRVDLPVPEELNGAAADEWRRMLAALPSDQLGELDRGLLVGYCHYWAQWRVATEKAHAEGEVIVLRNDKGEVRTVQQNPWLAIGHRAFVNLSNAAAALGFSPQARARAGLKKDLAKRPGVVGSLLAARETRSRWEQAAEDTRLSAVRQSERKSDGADKDNDITTNK